MLYDGIIDMRFAIPCEKLEEGDFHDKFGIFYKGNDALSFSGSINDSKHGFQNFSGFFRFSSGGPPLPDISVKNRNSHLAAFAAFVLYYDIILGA